MAQNNQPNRKIVTAAGIAALLILFPLIRDLVTGKDIKLPTNQSSTLQVNDCIYALCANVTINPGSHQPAPAESTPKVSAPEPATKLQLEETLPPQDLSVNFRWSEPNKNGRSYALENGSRLYNGDEFTIQINAQKEQYIYLMHFDSHGQVQELMQLSGHSNKIHSGETRELPGKGKHFTLDANPGQETFHLLIANQPLQTVIERYKQGLLQKADINQVEYKGIFIQADHQTQKTPAKHIACRSNGNHCHYSFTIQHLPGKR